MIRPIYGILAAFLLSFIFIFANLINTPALAQILMCGTDWTFVKFTSNPSPPTEDSSYTVLGHYDLYYNDGNNDIDYKVPGSGFYHTLSWYCGPDSS